MELLEVENLYKEFYKDKVKFAAVDHIHFSIREGECLGLVGESGCGKSTTASLIAGLLKPDKGTFRFLGEELTKSSSRRIRKNIQMIFQNPMDSFDPRYHLLSSVQQGLRYVEKCDKRELERRAQEAISFVGLKESYYKKPIHQLSGGECQRAAIARAIIGQPKLLICDEATSALDPQTTSSILELLKKINKQFGITIVIITHQMSVVREICTHVAIMYEGEVVEQGLVADIFANPQSEVAKELIRKDTGSDIDADSRLDAGREKGQAEIKSGEKIRIVFSENSAFEPVIANLILTFGEPVNILKADTKNVGGVAKGEMILEFMEGSTRTEMMKQYLKEKGLAIGEVTEYVGS